jgi:hypothetical protein
VHAECPGETGLQPERYPAAVAEGSQARPAVAHTAGRGKHTVLGVAAEEVREPVLASAVERVAVRSWLLRPGTTDPTQPSWLASAVVAEPELEAAGCRSAGVHTTRLLEVAAVVRQRKEALAVTGLRRVLANLRCCCLHKR